MGTYDDIGIPVQGQPISSGSFGLKVRADIIDLDRRMSIVEGSLLPRYYVKANTTSRNTTITPAADTGTGQLLAGIPLEVGTYEVELVGLFTLSTTGTQGIRTRWGFTGTVANPVRTCLGPADSATAPNANATIMAQAYQATGQDASYFTATSAAFGGFREIASGFAVTVAGSLSLNWAQSVSSANNTNLQGGSYFRITRYA
jgi:hypothetical protein